MGLEYLDQLALKLGTDKSADCRRAISKILEATKDECARGVFQSAFNAKETLMDRVSREIRCRTPKPALWRKVRKSSSTKYPSSKRWIMVQMAQTTRELLKRECGRTAVNRVETGPKTIKLKGLREPLIRTP